MLCYDRIDTSVVMSNACHDLTMLSVNISDIAIITIENVDYQCIIHNISKCEAIILLKHFLLEHCGYIWKNFVWNFSLFKTVFLLFCLVYIKWLIVWASMSLNISIEAVMKNSKK